MPTKGEAIERGGAERAALHEVLEGYANALAVEAGRMEYYGLTADETAAKIAEQNILVTMTQIREIVKDKDLIDFFRSWAGTEQTA